MATSHLYYRSEAKTQVMSLHKSLAGSEKLEMGSRLCLTAYIFYIDFASMCSRNESILYADDTVLVYLGTSLQELTDHVNKRLRNTLERCNCKKLSLNPTKIQIS